MDYLSVTAKTFFMWICMGLLLILTTPFNLYLLNFTIPFIMRISKNAFLKCLKNCFFPYISLRFWSKFEEQLCKILFENKLIGQRQNSQEKCLPKSGQVFSYACLTFRLSDYVLLQKWQFLCLSYSDQSKWRISIFNQWKIVLFCWFFSYLLKYA